MTDHMTPMDIVPTPTARRSWSTPKVIFASTEGTSVPNPSFTYEIDSTTTDFGGRLGPS